MGSPVGYAGFLTRSQKQAFRFVMPPPYSRKGLRGWMTNVTAHFPLKREDSEK